MPTPKRLLDIRLNGPAVKDHRIPVDDFARLIHNVQLATKRLGQRIAGQEGRRTGRLIKEIEAACSLEIVAIQPGSVRVQLGLPAPSIEPLLFGDTGAMALERLLDGLEMLDHSDDQWPKDFDPAVTDPVLELGRILSHGVDTIEFGYGVRKGRPRSVSYTHKLRDRISKRIEAPEAKQISLVGFLLEIDFKDRTAEIHQPLGQVVRISYPESLADMVLEGARKQVKVLGTGGRDGAGRIGRVEAAHLEICEDDTAAYVAEQQQLSLVTQDDPFAGLGPIVGLSSFFGNYPDKRNPEDAIRTLRTNREPRKIE